MGLVWVMAMKKGGAGEERVFWGAILWSLEWREYKVTLGLLFSILFSFFHFHQFSFLKKII